jgi:ketosteroid isomerase-like protein
MTSVKCAFDEYVRALTSRDQRGLEDSMTEDFRFTSTAARLLNKTARLRNILENPVFFESLRFRNVEFEMYGDTGLVFAEFQYQGLEPTSLQFGRSTFVFGRQAGAWKLVAQHNSHAPFEVG